MHNEAPTQPAWWLAQRAVRDTGDRKIFLEYGKNTRCVQEGPCAFVFQNPDNQVVMPTVASEVALGTGKQKLSQPDVQAIVQRCLEQVRAADQITVPCF